MAGILLVATVFSVATATVTPAQLRTELQSATAGEYQQKIEAAGSTPLPTSLLDKLRNEPNLSPPVRDWLLYQMLLQLRHQHASADWQRELHLLTQYPNQYFIDHDFEGRSRPLPLAPVGQAATGTLQLWQLQQRAEQIQTSLSPERLQQGIAGWSTASKLEQQAWQLAIRSLPESQMARMGDLNSTQLADKAPALAAEMALRRQDVDLARAVLQQQGNQADTSRLLQQIELRFSPADQLTLYRAARGNPLLQTQSWFAVAKLAAPDARHELQHAAAAGDRGAIAAWVQQQGDEALPELRRWLKQDHEARQLNAIYALRLLNTPAAQQALKAAHGKPASARVQQELKQ